ncbi:hypothetical protein KKC00_01730 [Patescibacteria group bacterium]|nr:hypothetical protein [Patescibacteria group bacterium]
MRNIKKRRLFFCSLAFFIFIFLTALNVNINKGKLEINSVSAFEISYPPVLGITITNESNLADFANYFFNLGMFIAASLALFSIVIGGIHWLVSFGIGKITSEGKEWVKSGILGLLILLSSYSIAATINPELKHFSLEGLHLGTPFIRNIDNNNVSNIEEITYKEIPIGTLTETLLTRTIDCYNFDENGNPVDGDKNTAGWEPTLMNGDRMECILQLSEAIARKVKVSSDLSKEIAKLMDQCVCKNPPCDFDCTQPCQFTQCPNGACTGDCAKTPCKGGDCCPSGIKDKIEHGPIKFGPNANEEYKGLDEFRSQHENIIGAVEEEIVIKGDGVKIIKRDVWGNLRLVDQINYLKEKIKIIKESVEKDLNNLKNAETELSECYFIKPYVELLKLIEKTDNKKTTIKVEEIFKDPVTNQNIDISKYCMGFNYKNSDCFQACQNSCPGINENALSKLRACVVDIDRLSSGALSAGETDCLKKAFHLCPGKNSDTFDKCLTDCKKRCLSLCDEKYLPNSAEIKSCQDKCNNDSNCLIKNEGDCYVSFVTLKECANRFEDFSEFKKCAEGAFGCKYCSDQYAGYPDCLKKGTGTEYYYSYLFENQNKIKCKDCSTIAGEWNACRRSFPEALKCPSCSPCPACPCEQIISGDDNIYGVCSGQCGEFSYNDDPLTFYCRYDYWEELEEKISFPLGREKVCPLENEIPIGQTVDETEYWAKKIVELIENYLKEAEDAAEYIKTIGAEKDYCLCSSSCGGNESICEGSCEFWQEEVIDIDSETGEPIGSHWECGCTQLPCSGHPCQKIINLLRGKTPDQKCPEGVEYKGVEWYAEKIWASLKDLMIFNEETKSEALKMLIYSRKIMDKCSFAAKLFKEDVKLLNCKRLEAEIISPIIYGRVIIGVFGKILAESTTSDKTLKKCYGKDVSDLLNISEPLLDNWFCCEGISK